MAGEYTSITDAVVLVSTIVGWNYLFDWLAFHYPPLQRVLEPPPLLVVHNGRVLWRQRRAEKAFVEADGEISVVKRRGPST